MKLLLLLASVILISSISVGNDVSAETRARIRAFQAEKYQEEAAKKNQEASIKKSLADMKKEIAANSAKEFDEALAAAEKKRHDDEMKAFNAEMKAASDKFLVDQAASEKAADESRAKMDADFRKMMAESAASRSALEEEIQANRKRIARTERRIYAETPRLSTTPPSVETREDKSVSAYSPPLRSVTPPPSPTSGVIFAPSGNYHWNKNLDGTINVQSPGPTGFGPSGLAPGPNYTVDRDLSGNVYITP